MTTPANGALWRPVVDLSDLSVVVADRDGQLRVELVDGRVWVELASLTPGNAAALSVVLAEQARRAGWGSAP